MAITETNPAVAHRLQPLSKLCWATSILMVREVLKGANQYITVDKIVQRTLSSDPGTNKTGKDHIIASAMYDWLGGGNLVPGPISIDAAKASIDAGKPFIIGIGWYLGGGHAVVVGGYDRKSADWGLLKIFDPLAPRAATISTDRLRRGDYDPDYTNGGENLGINSPHAGRWDVTFMIP
jgi:hypothetical protein